MALYRKRPVVIEAIQYTGKNYEEIRDFVGDSYGEWDDRTNAIFIKTLEGDMRADVGAFIIKGVSSEFYPCREEIFIKTYEAVEEQ